MREQAPEKKWSKEELEAEVKKTILARAPDFKAQASSLTFEGARRAIEQDLGMRRFLLDEHKEIVKHCLNECLSAKDGDKAPEPSENNMEIRSEGASNFDDAEIRSGESEVSEHTIKEAIKKRASFFKKNAETISLMKVRRLLEEDLNLVNKALDAYKAFISTELEKVLQSLVVNKSENGGQKKPKKASQKVEEAQTSKISKRSREEPAPSDNASGEEEHSDELEPKRRKKEVNKVKANQKSSGKEKRKSNPASKGKKTGKKEREETSVEEREGGSSSDNNESRSSDEENVKNKREKPTPPVYGKDVERLKSIIKSCGASIPPAVYRRAKQAPEDKREAFLIKELKDILEKEGLSANPSEKEIKEVKRRKDRAKELEGIDTSNIITSSRRRSSAFSFIPPPKPPKLELSSSEEDEDDDEEDDDVVDMEKGAPHDDGNDDDSDEHGDADKGGDNGNDDGYEREDVDEGGNDGNDDDGDEREGSGKDGSEDKE